MTLREIVAGNLRRLRQANGLTQEELAHGASLDRNYVGMLERGENAPTVDTLERLAQALGIDPVLFMDRTFARPVKEVTPVMALPDRQEPIARIYQSFASIDGLPCHVTGRSALWWWPSTAAWRRFVETSSVHQWLVNRFLTSRRKGTW